MANADRRPSYFRAAFANLYNLTMLAGVTVAAAATGEPWLLGVGLAVEALWLLFATDSPRFRRAVDARETGKRRLEQIRRMQEQAQLLPHGERARVQGLGARVAEVKAEVQRNPRITGEFMHSQLDRLDELVAEFVHLAVTANRSESYLARSDPKQINRDRDAQRRIMDAGPDENTRDIARQNKEILEKRLAIIEDLERFVARARGQMSLIENTIHLLRDQVMTMATPEALSTQLDSLVASVDALREAQRDVDAIVGVASSPGPSRDALAEAGPPVDVSESDGAPREKARTR